MALKIGFLIKTRTKSFMFFILAILLCLTAAVRTEYSEVIESGDGQSKLGITYVKNDGMLVDLIVGKL